MRGVFQLCILGLLLGVGVPASAPAEITERPSKELRDRTLDFVGSGIQVGDTVPDFELKTLEGDSVPLSALWLSKPTVLVTGSVTCPVARRRMRQVDRMRNHFGDQVQVVVLYTLEAHPKGAGSPYAIDRVQWLTKENIHNEIYFPQPQSFDQRIKHAETFVERMRTETPVFLDGMDNEIWKGLGGGPNVGILIGTDGQVHVKHGWFDGGSMYKSVEIYLDKVQPGWREYADEGSDDVRPTGAPQVSDQAPAREQPLPLDSGADDRSPIETPPLGEAVVGETARDEHPVRRNH